MNLMTASDRDPRDLVEHDDTAIGRQAADWWARLRSDDFTQADADALRA